MGIRPATAPSLLLLLALAASPHAQVEPAPYEVARALDTGRATLQRLVLPADPRAPFEVDVVLDGSAEHLVLAPHSLRAPGFRLLVQDAQGALAEHEPAPVATLRGHVAGRPGSRVAATLRADGLHAWVLLDPARAPFGVQPSGLPGLHAVHDGGDALAGPLACGTPDLPGRPAPAAGPGDTPAPNVTCEIACDADFEFYQANGSSVAATQLDIETVLNGVEAIYANDVDIEYAITTILVRTAEPDPFTSLSPNTLLNQFSNHWNSSQQAVARDVAHLFTGKELDGSVIGIAQLSVICSKSSAYGLSQSRFTANMTSRVGLTAHELGHNWSASHCDGAPDCWIMCSGLGGCAGNLTKFGAGEKAQIEAKKSQVGCLTPSEPPPPPVIASVSPAQVPAWLGGNVTIAGSAFAQANGLQLGGQALHEGSDWFVIDDGTILLPSPAATALGPVEITVTNPSGTSNPGSFTFVETDPPVLAVPFVAFTDLELGWILAGGAGDLGFLLVGLSPATFTYQGQAVLATDLILWSGPLDAAGLGSTSLLLPPAALGLTLWSQLATLDGGTLATSVLASTWIPF